MSRITRAAGFVQFLIEPLVVTFYFLEPVRKRVTESRATPAPIIT